MEPCWLCGDEHYCDECCVFVIHPESDSGYVELAPGSPLLDPCAEIVDQRIYEHWKGRGLTMYDLRFDTA